MTELKQAQKELTHPKNRWWVIHALTAGFFYGINGFLVNSLCHLGLAGLGAQAFGVLFFAVFYISYQPQLTEEEVKWTYFRSEDQTRLDKSKIIAIAIRSCLSLFQILLLFSAFKYASAANLNPKIISALFCFGSFASLILFFSLFRERPTLMQLFAMAFTTFGVFLISMEGDSFEDTIHYASKQDKVATIWCLVAVALAMCMSCANCVVVRYFTTVRKFDASRFALDGLVLCSMYFLPFGISSTLEYFDFFKGSLAGIFLALAVMH